MDMEYARSRLYGFTEDFVFLVGQYTLLGIACLLGGIQSVLGALSTMARDKSEQIKEIRCGKEDSEAGKPVDLATRIPEGSSDEVEVVADEVAVSVGESEEPAEGGVEEPDSFDGEDEGPSDEVLYDGNSQNKTPVPS